MIADDSGLRRALPILLLLALAHFVLALWYAQATPYRTPGVLFSQKNPETGLPQAVPDVGAPDERQHANYIAHLREGKGFPVLVWQLPNPADPSKPLRNPDLGETYQSHQPPLYYLLAQGWSSLTGADPTGPTGIRIRWLNGLIGAGTVVGVFYACFWGTGRTGLSLVAAGFAAFLPMNLALSGAISNDPLLFLLCTWFLGVGALVLRDGLEWKYVLWLGVLLGLASLTKTTAISLFAVFAYLALARRGDQEAIVRVGAAFMLGIAIVAFWWMRNNSLYGDPLAMTAFNEAFVGSPQAFAFIHTFGMGGYLLNWVGGWTAQSFFGVFGYMDIFLRPHALYWVLGVLLLVGLLGFLWRATQGFSKGEKQFHVMNAVFLVVVVLLFIRFNLQYFQGQARYVFPAIAPISIGVALGWTALAKDRAKWAGVGTVAVLFALNLYILSSLPEQFKARTDPSMSSQESPDV
jgi:4-amino-4-deoxy-L-arabinose transferase-like glycosyltransferase